MAHYYKTLSIVHRLLHSIMNLITLRSSVFIRCAGYNMRVQSHQQKKVYMNYYRLFQISLIYISSISLKVATKYNSDIFLWCTNNGLKWLYIIHVTFFSSIVLNYNEYEIIVLQELFATETNNQIYYCCKQITWNMILTTILCCLERCGQCYDWHLITNKYNSLVVWWIQEWVVCQVSNCFFNTSLGSRYV